MFWVFLWLNHDLAAGITGSVVIWDKEYIPCTPFVSTADERLTPVRQALPQDAKCEI